MGNDFKAVCGVTRIAQERRELSNWASLPRLEQIRFHPMNTNGGEIMLKRTWKNLVSNWASCVAGGFVWLAATTVLAQSGYRVTILHHNDAESRLFNLGSGAASNYGGMGRFKTLLDRTRNYYTGQGHGVLAISAGDSFLAGANFQASLDSGTPGSREFYDALGISQIGYDAVTLGNHEFDFGTQVLAEFIGDAQATNPTTFLSANLNFSADAGLQAHVAAGRIAKSLLKTVSTSAGDKKVGIIGATTETLPYVSSPGEVVVGSVATAVNAEIASLKAQGADLIVLSSHLQGLANEQSLVAQLNPGVNLIIAGGGDELMAGLANPRPTDVYTAAAPGSVANTGLVPVAGYNNTSPPNVGSYPLPSTASDLGGNAIPIVTSRDSYSYLGRVTLDISSAGVVTVEASSNPQRVASSGVDPIHGVAVDPGIQSAVLTPVQNYLNSLGSEVIGQTSVELVRNPGIRFRETNLGNLVADAFLAKARDLAPTQGVDTPVLALANGGGIRDFISSGNITKLDTFDVSPFGNLVTVVQDVTTADFKLLLENAVSKLSDTPAPGPTPTGTDGRFAQVSGFAFTYDLFAQPLLLTSGGTLLQEGRRIRSARLDDGTVLIEEGKPVAGLTVDVATLNFLASGGDQYFDSDYLSQDYFQNTRILGVSDQQALEAYIRSFNNFDLALDSRYDARSDGRILAVPEPSSLLLVAVGLAGWWIHRRRLSLA